MDKDEDGGTDQISSALIQLREELALRGHGEQADLVSKQTGSQFEGMSDVLMNAATDGSAGSV
jgi:hypothetical protein